MNGVVVIDKPQGLTSHDVVSAVKRRLGAKKAGHTGTLDPMATGVLPVCLGEATKLARFLSATEKSYRATMQLGVETDTLDADGRVTAQREPTVCRDDVERVLAGFVGTIEQQPPSYSAVKVRGKALYAWTRQGVAVEAAPRRVTITALRVEEVSLPYITFSVTCSAGTYIRSLCADAGQLLGCGACLTALRRTRSGAFDVSMAVSLDDPALGGHIVPLAEAVQDLPACAVDETWERRIRDGVSPSAEAFKDNDISLLSSGDVIKLTSFDGRLLAMAAVVLPEEPSAAGDSAVGAKILRVFHDEKTTPKVNLR